MLQHLYQYYADEKSGFVYALPAGVLFLLAGILLAIKYSANPVSKGLGTGWIIVGALLITGSCATLYYNNKKIEGLAARQTETAAQLQRSEIQRMDKVMNVTFRYAFITFAVLITALVWVAAAAKSYYWKGFSIAFISLVLLLLVSDTYSSKRNAAYFKKIRELKF